MLIHRYFTDPQYLIKLTGSDDVIFSFNDDDTELCTVIVSLMQKESRERAVKGDTTELFIRFDIFKVKYYYNLL